jgi:hypothetical protein
MTKILNSRLFVLYRFLSVVVFSLIIILSLDCDGSKDMNSKYDSNKNMDINLVKEKYVDELMKIPGVVGVYVGETDEKYPCITVMIKEETDRIKKQIPKEIEEFPVIIEVTGEIKPM